MGMVTVIGASGNTVTLPFSTNDAANLAQALSKVIGSAADQPVLLAAGSATVSAHVTAPTASPLQFVSNTTPSTVIGGAGSPTIFGGAQSSHDSVTGAAGSASVSALASSGNDSLSSGASHDLISFVNGAAKGSDLMLGFNGADSVSLSGYGTNGGVSDMQQVGSSVVVTLHDNTQITFNNATDAKNVHGLG